MPKRKNADGALLDSAAFPASPIAPVPQISATLPYLIIVLMALGIAAAQAGIGGMKLLYALPAYGIIGLAALCSLFEPARRISTGTSARCLAAAITLAACIVLRAVYSPVDYLARHDLFMVLATLTTYLLATIFLSESRPRLVMLAILFTFAGAHLACGVVQFRYGQFMFFEPWIERLENAWRASGFFLSPNHLAGLLEMLGVMAASLACWSNWRLVARMIAGYMALLCFIGVALTGSRGGYVSTLTGLLVFAGLSLYVVRRLRPAHFWSTVVAVIMLFSAAIGGGGTLMLKSQTLKDRLDQIENAGNTRLIIWDAAAKQFALSRITGTGSGTHVFLGRQLRAKPVERDATHVQNDYLELLCEYGLLGAVAMAAFLGIHLWTGLGGLRRILAELDDVGWGSLNDELALLLGALSGLAALAVHSCFDGNLHVPGNTLVVALFFSILAAPTIETLLPEERAAPSLAIHWLRFLPPVIGLYLLVVGVPRVEAEFYAECAARAIRADDFPTAARCAESGIAVEKKNPHLFYYFGEAHAWLASAHEPDSAEFFRESHEALGAFHAGLELFPDDLRLLLALGRTLDNYGRFNEAGPVFEKALAADPVSAAAHALHGRHFAMQNNLKDAALRYQRAVNLGAASGDFSSARLEKIPAQRKIDNQPQP